MASMPWVKLYTEILDDCKVGRLPDNLRWRFISLICLAGECDSDGYLATGTGAMGMSDIAWRLRVNAEEISQELEILRQTGLVSFDDDAQCWIVVNFLKRQGRSQDERRQQWRDRKARQRGNDPPCEDVTRESRGTSTVVTPLEESRVEKIKIKRRGEESGGACAPASPARPPAVDVYRSIAHTFPEKALWAQIGDAVGDGQDALDLWKRVVEGYIMRGWNKRNIAGMLEFYQRCEVPSSNGNGKSSDRKRKGAMAQAIEEFASET